MYLNFAPIIFLSFITEQTTVESTVESTTMETLYPGKYHNYIDDMCVGLLRLGIRYTDQVLVKYS